MTGPAFQYILRKGTEMGLYVRFGIFFVTILVLWYLWISIFVIRRK
jgi:hypothetical protein